MAIIMGAPDWLVITVGVTACIATGATLQLVLAKRMVT